MMSSAGDCYGTFLHCINQKFEGIPCDKSRIVGEHTAVTKKTSPCSNYVRYFVSLPGEIK